MKLARELKGAQRGKTHLEWIAWCRTRHGLGKARAHALVRVAEGKITLEGDLKRHRARQAPLK